MQRAKSILLCVCCTLFIGTNVSAQKKWTLQECIDYALSNNIQIKQSELNTQLSKYEVDQSKATFLPDINASIGHSYNFGRSIDPYTNLYTNNEIQSTNLGASASMVLFSGLQLVNSLKQSKLNYLSSKYEEKKIQNDVTINVVTAYLQVLYAKENFKNASEQFDATQLQRDRTKKLFDAGSVSKGNLLDIEAQLATDEVSKTDAEVQLTQALLTLTQLLELNTMNDFDVVDPAINSLDGFILPADVVSVYQLATQNQPDVIASDYRVKSSEKGLSLAKASHYPRLSLSGGIGTASSTTNRKISSISYGPPPLIGYTTDTVEVYSVSPTTNYGLTDIPLEDQLKNNRNQYISFNLSIPIFNGWSTRTNVKRAQTTYMQSQLNHEQLKKSLFKNVQQAYVDASSAFKKYTATERSLQSAQEAFSFNEQRYNLGLINTYDYLLSKNNLAKSQTAIVQAKYDYIFRIKILDFYQGKPLTF